jgi:DNA invertase Pin-like site-specific DNA recombinase
LTIAAIHPSGKLWQVLSGDFAEIWGYLIQERVRAGLDNARRKGKRPGRRPYFDITSLGTLACLRDRGMSVRAIAREMKVSKSLVHKSLKILNVQVQENHGSEEEKSAVHE